MSVAGSLSAEPQGCCQVRSSTSGRSGTSTGHHTPLSTPRLLEASSNSHSIPRTDSRAKGRPDATVEEKTKPLLFRTAQRSSRTSSTSSSLSKARSHSMSTCRTSRPFNCPFKTRCSHHSSPKTSWSRSAPVSVGNHSSAAATQSLPPSTGPIRQTCDTSLCCKGSICGAGSAVRFCNLQRTLGRIATRVVCSILYRGSQHSGTRHPSMQPQHAPLRGRLSNRLVNSALRFSGSRPKRPFAGWLRNDKGLRRCFGQHGPQNQEAPKQIPIHSDIRQRAISAAPTETESEQFCIAALSASSASCTVGGRKRGGR